MLKQSETFTAAIKNGHSLGLAENKKSLIIGEGVNYLNGADGTTKELIADYADQLHDVPVSEAAFTGMAVGAATSGYNIIVHHGRVEFSLLAMDQILTQAAKWNFMFGGDYPCRLGLRLNIGRQWGNGPQHTSSYNSLFVNTPGLDIFWPSTPEEAMHATYLLHTVSSPTVSMEHRYLFQTKMDIDLKSLPVSAQNYPKYKIYGSSTADVAIITYGDGFAEALKVKKILAETINVKIICITKICGDRSLSNEIIQELEHVSQIIIIDTSNFQGGLLQSVLGAISVELPINGRTHIHCPPFTPCPTSPALTKRYYPKAPEIAKNIANLMNVSISVQEYDFDEIHLPMQIDFSDFDLSCHSVY
ncbi:hypothetical protein N9I36_01240 [Planktomarina temperata]|nr:hypothetical protein [Planktomarina temperata]